MANSIEEVQKTLRAHKVSYSYIASAGRGVLSVAVTPMTKKILSKVALANARRGALALNALGYHVSITDGTLGNGKRFVKLLVQAGAAKANPRKRNPPWANNRKTLIGTRLRIVKDIVDIRKGKKVLVACIGDRGITIDQDKLSDWPKVKLDNGRRVIVDMEDGEAVVDTDWVAPAKHAKKNPACANPHKAGDSITIHHAQGTWRGKVAKVSPNFIYLVGPKGGTATLVRNANSGRLSGLVVSGRGMPRSYAVRSLE